MNDFKSDIPERSRQERESSKEVWIVDDEEMMVGSVLRFWQLKAKGITFHHFITAQSALNELRDRQAAGEKMPNVIFVDGKLTKDKGDLQYGTTLIKEIRNFEGIVQPVLIAHSSDESLNQEMLNIGADQGFHKLEIKKTADFLASLE